LDRAYAVHEHRRNSRISDYVDDGDGTAVRVSDGDSASFSRPSRVRMFSTIAKALLH